MKVRIKGVALLLALVLIFTGQITALAAEDRISAAVKETASYIYQRAKNPQVGPVGGEWAIIGLARLGFDVPQSYYVDYDRSV